jgi:NAD(P)-dependent dehydrogenase (short-subunit alcohol dehydrogenase family)
MTTTSRPPTRPLALVTGSSRGIGLAVAHALAADHALILSARNPEELAQAAATLPEGAVRGTVVADLGEASARARAIAEIAAIAAGFAAPVQVVVHNAGIAPAAAFAATDEALLLRTLEVNLVAPFALTRALLPAMIASGWGRVIHVASTAALKGYRFTAAYSASKAGLVGLTRALAAEFARSPVTINAVCPGFVATRIVDDAVAAAAARGKDAAAARQAFADLSPQGRLLAAEEVAALVAYLTTDAARSVHGQALALDGGVTA